MGIDTNSHSDAASTNTKYDPDEDGDVENVDLSEYGGEVSDGTAKGNFSQVSTPDTNIGTAHSAHPDDIGSDLVSSGDMDIYVSPSGSDTNNGKSQSEPFASIHRAAAEIPKAVYHDVDLHIDYGDYSSNDDAKPHIENIYQTARSHSADGPYNGSGVRLLGHTPDNDFYDSNKSIDDYNLGYLLIAGVRGSEDFLLKSLRFEDTRPQNYDARVRYEDCKFVGGDGGNDPNHSVGGHASLCTFKGCDFVASGTNSTANDIFNFLDQSHVQVDNCSSTGYDRSAKLRSGTILAFRGSDLSCYFGPNNTPQTDDSCLVTGANFQVRGDGGVRAERLATEERRKQFTQADSPERVLTADNGNGGETFEQVFNGSVGTSAEKIAGVRTGGAIVMGQDANNAGIRFSDFVLLARTDTTVVNRAEDGSPEARTYNLGGGTFELSMASSTYDISVASFGGLF